MVTVGCDQCGKEFEQRAYLVQKNQRQGWKNYCSTSCRDAAKRGRRGQPTKPVAVLTCPQCGKEFEVSPPNEARRRKYCSWSCSGKAGGRKPRDHENRFVRTDGYISVFVPPEDRPTGHEDKAYFLEHRYVMSKLLGRWPTRAETIHHVNGDNTDNRPENLQLRSGSHGRGHILRCRCCGSSDIEYIELD